MLCAYWKHIPWVARWKAATARSTCMQLQWRPRDRPGVFYLQPGSNGWSTMALRRSGSLQTPFLTSAVPDSPTSPLDFAFEEWATKSCRQIFGVREHVTSACGSPQHAPARVREESAFGRYVWCGVVRQHNKYIKVRYMWLLDGMLTPRACRCPLAYTSYDPYATWAPTTPLLTLFQTDGCTHRVWARITARRYTSYSI